MWLQGKTTKIIIWMHLLLYVYAFTSIIKDIAAKNSTIEFKVQTLWKGLKNFKQSPTWFDVYLVNVKCKRQIKWEIVSKFVAFSKTWTLPYVYIPGSLICFLTLSIWKPLLSIAVLSNRP